MLMFNNKCHVLFINCTQTKKYTLNKKLNSYGDCSISRNELY